MSYIVDSEQAATTLLDEAGAIQDKWEQGDDEPERTAQEVISRVEAVVEFYLRASGNTSQIYSVLVEPVVKWGQWAFMPTALQLGQTTPEARPYASAVEIVHGFLHRYEHLKAPD